MIRRTIYSYRDIGTLSPRNNLAKAPISRMSLLKHSSYFVSGLARLLSTTSLKRASSLYLPQQDYKIGPLNSRLLSLTRAHTCMQPLFPDKNVFHVSSFPNQDFLICKSPFSIPHKMPYSTLASRLHDVSRMAKQIAPLIRPHNTLRQHKICSSSIHTIANNTQFRTMEGIQSLATSPTREHIENIRGQLSTMNAKCNDNQQITLEKDFSTCIATVCIKSGCKNGISAKMMCDLLDVIDELYRWDEGKGVIIYGYGGFFCSGGDLVSVRELANYEDGLKVATLMQYNLLRLQSLPMITMALIQGKAIGGGAEIAVATDMRVITSNAKMGYVHVRVGICAAWGGGSRLVQLVGPARALEMMASGRLVGAQDAYHMGLVNHIIDDCDENDIPLVMEKATNYLKAHLIGAKSTIIAMKGLVNAARTLPLEQALVAECQLISSTWGKGPHLEALNNNVKHNDA